MHEYWDIYNERRHCTGRVHRRGIPLAEGDFHLVVQIWTVCGDCILLTQRHPKKHFPLLWECTGGSVLSGESSLTGAVRELHEETGIAVSPEQLTLLLTERHNSDSFLDTYLCMLESPKPTVVLQEGETVDFKWCTERELYAMVDAGLVVNSVARQFYELRDRLLG